MKIKTKLYYWLFFNILSVFLVIVEEDTIWKLINVLGLILGVFLFLSYLYDFRKTKTNKKGELQ